MTNSRYVKKMVRALAAEHGIKYTTALRLFEANRETLIRDSQSEKQKAQSERAFQTALGNQSRHGDDLDN